MKKEYIPLFNKGHIWNISIHQTNDYKITISRQYGLCKGKQTLIDSIVYKNKEMSAWEHAIHIADTLYKDQIDIGFQPLTSVPKPFIRPMLAHTYFDTNGIPLKNKEKYIMCPFYVQPKIDGVRLLIGKHSSGMSFIMSRTGKTINNINHISDELLLRLKPGDCIDGELFASDMTFEDIISICRTKANTNVNNKKLIFHAFDMFRLEHMNDIFSDRFKMLRIICVQLSFTHTVPIILCTTKIDIPKLLHKYISDGHEGMMIRNDAVYKLNGRSNDLQKVKNFLTDEFIISGFQEASGRDKGTVVWECTSKHGKFKVRPRGTIDTRKSWFLNGHAYIGKQLTVRYQNMTEHGIPRFPVGIAIRDYE